jgi:hypothetical protein
MDDCNNDYLFLILTLDGVVSFKLRPLYCRVCPTAGVKSQELRKPLSLPRIKHDSWIMSRKSGHCTD